MSRIKNIYRQVFLFHEQHLNAPGTAEEWEQFTNDMSKTANALNNDPLANELLIAVYNELERQSYMQA